MSLKSLWEKFIQNRPVYQKLATKYERATTDLTDVRHEHEGTTAKLDEVQHTLNNLEKDHARLRGEYDHAMADLDEALLVLSQSQAKRGALQQQYERATQDLANVQQNFQQWKKEREQTKAALGKSRHRVEQLKKECSALTEKNAQKETDLEKAQHRVKQLKKERKQITTALNWKKGALDELRAEHKRVTTEHERTTMKLERATTTLNAARAEHDKLKQKYTLISDLLKAKSSKNEAFEKFKELFDGEFMAFANEESSLAEEAAAVKKLQHFEKCLKEIVAFPHTYTKKSIGIGGGFNSGKSEFVNSFITKPDVKMPVDIIPTTAISSFVISSSKVSIKGFSRYRATVDIEPAFYHQLSHRFAETFSFNLKDLMPSIAVEVPLREGLFENICLIDTPGYDSAGGSTDHDRKTAAKDLKDRDALIWMIGVDTNGTIPRDDLDFILKDLKLNGLPFYVVLNKADYKPKSELKDILEAVKKTLENAGIEPKGISAYSALLREEYLFDEDGVSLHDFFRSQNRPKEGLETDLREEIESVFAMYEKAIRKDERTAKVLMKELNTLDLDISEHTKIPLDEQDVLSEKIGKIKNSQEKDFASIKAKMKKIKKDILKAADEVLYSLGAQPAKQVVRPPSAPISKSEHGSASSGHGSKVQGNIRVEKAEKSPASAPRPLRSQRKKRTDKPKPPFVNPEPPPPEQGSPTPNSKRSAVKRQGSIKGGKYIRADAEQSEKPSAHAPKSELVQRMVNAVQTGVGPKSQPSSHAPKSEQGSPHSSGNIGSEMGEVTATKEHKKRSHAWVERAFRDEQDALQYINKASASSLATRFDIRPYIAKNIVDYRTRNGPFQRLDDLKRIRGIVGYATFERLRTGWLEQSALQYINKAPANSLATRLIIRLYTAKNIVDYRTRNGPFQRLDDLKRIHGIGAATLERLRTRLFRYLEDILRDRNRP